MASNVTLPAGGTGDTTPVIETIQQTSSGSPHRQVIASKEVTITQTITRPANTTTYTIGDALMDTAATAGGDTLTSIASISGGSGRITDILFIFDEDAAVPLTGEYYLFDTSFTNPGDNVAFAVSDAEAKTLVGMVPFALRDIGNNGFFHAQNLSIGYTCVGSANLRTMVRVTNGYIPTTNSSVLTIRVKAIQS